MSIGPLPVISAGFATGSLKANLAKNGYVVLKDFLEPTVAEQVHTCLDQDVSWELAYMNGPQAASKSTEQLRLLSPEDRQRFHENVIAQATQAYQFAYFRYPMLDAYLNNWSPRLLLNDVLESMNTQPTLNFFRDVTGDREVRKVELQATLFTRGHFLKRHNDFATTTDDRRYACVIGLSKDWESDWGGILQFVDNKLITHSFTPEFNTCILFKVPRDHQVSYVAPYAMKPRYSLTGWLRAD